MTASSNSLAEHRDNHQFLSAIGAFFDSRFPGALPLSQFVPADFDPSRRVTSAERQGYRQAVNDMLEMTVDFTPQQLADADAYLKARGASTLTQMRERRKNLASKILKRGKIRNETEFYFLNELVSDTASSLTDTQRQAAGTLLRAFEESM